MRTINQAGVELIKSFEGLSLTPYLDSGGVATIGIGTILYPDGVRVTMQDARITEQQAEGYLQVELTDKEIGVERCVTAQINDNQFAALVSFAYNLGLGALQGSTLLRLLNSGDVSGAADEFLKWNHDGGQVIAGLTRRREAERSLFLQPVPASTDDSILRDIQEKLSGNLS